MQQYPINIFGDITSSRTPKEKCFSTPFSTTTASKTVGEANMGVVNWAQAEMRWKIRSEKQKYWQHAKPLNLAGFLVEGDHSTCVPCADHRCARAHLIGVDNAVKTNYFCTETIIYHVTQTDNNKFIDTMATISRTSWHTIAQFSPNHAPPRSFPFTRTNTQLARCAFKLHAVPVLSSVDAQFTYILAVNCEKMFVLLLPCWAQDQKFPQAKMFEQVPARTRVD